MSERSETETIVINEQTGGRKGSKLARYDLIPTTPLRLLAEHYGKGCEKYSQRNWERGYNWSLSYAALQRHMNEFWNGELHDEETGSLHVIAAAWHALALAEFIHTRPGLDDRACYTNEAATEC